MIDQDKMLSLAASLRKYTGTGFVVDDASAAADAIDALLAEVEAAAADKRDAERYREIRRGQHWSVVNGIGDVLCADELDATIDAVRAGGM